MSKTNNSIASQALMEMESIKAAIKEESKNTLKALLAEEVKNAIREAAGDDEDDDDMEIEDSADDKKTSKQSGKVEEDGELDTQEDPTVQAAGAEEMGTQDEVPAEGADTTDAGMGAQEAPAEGEGEDEWANYSQYQTGDDANTYDLTGEQDMGQVLKVYKLLKNDDEIVVKQDGNKIELQDPSNDTEYVIDLGEGEEEPEAAEVGGEEMPEEGGELNESLAGFPDDDEFEDDNEFEFDDDEFEDEDDEDFIDPDSGFESFGEDEFESEPETELGAYDDADEGMELPDEHELNEKKNTRKTMKERKEMMFEVDLGYTDNYQDKDPIEGLSNDEPSKSGKSWHKGVPTGTKKPWAGETKSKGEPFNKTVGKDLDEATNVGGAVQQRTTPKSNIPAGRKENGPKVKRHVSASNEYSEEINEAMKKIAKLEKENKALKECVLSLRENLQEAYVTNVNLGKFAKLTLENTTSQSEKIDIINRLSEAKTIAESKALYESISRELKKGGKSLTTENKVMSADTKNLNEAKKYTQQGLVETLDLIRRVENC